MQHEIEVKFLYVDHDKLRQKLLELGAVCEHPMRLMRRVMLDFPDKRFSNSNQSQRLRIRDEGDKVTLTYKEKSRETKYAYEIETTVGSFEDTLRLFKAIGLVDFSFQESKRETWKLNDVEVVLDEWPWAHTYIEIEGPNEETIAGVAEKLGFDWNKAKYGSVDTVYRSQYLGMTADESIGDLSEVRFNVPLPQYLKDRQKP
ncbi:class IV adenylate cyclase [Candidatus Saccharibacteria bacterium]|nr:class IV adenylate cyclase [Candidatus Saccharibacteria bacterium]